MTAEDASRMAKVNREVIGLLYTETAEQVRDLSYLCTVTRRGWMPLC